MRWNRVRAWIALKVLGFCLLYQAGSVQAGSGWMTWLKDSMSRPAPVAAPSWAPQNIYRPSPTLPLEVRRVAVLPLTIPRNDLDLLHGQDHFEPLLESELRRRGSVEWVNVTSDQLRLWTGRSNWSEEDELPRDLFVRLRENLRCDAVLFSRLSFFRSDPPMRMGWRFRLASIREETVEAVYWAADEAFDSVDPVLARSVARAASVWSVESGGVSADLARFSPRAFGRYTLEILLSTLPGPGQVHAPPRVAKVDAGPEKAKGPP